MGRPCELVSRAAFHAAGASFSPRPAMPVPSSAAPRSRPAYRQPVRVGGAYRDIMQKHDRFSARHIHP